METAHQPAILAVDDEYSIRELIKKVLKRINCHVTLASNADEALALLDQEPVDILITDHLMPGKTGLELIINTAKTHPETIKIMLTGVGNRDLYREAINLGDIYSVIEKPFNTPQFISTVQSAIELHRHRQAARRELERIKKQYHTIFDNTTDLIQSIDINQNIIYVNPAWHKVLGYSQEELPALSLDAIIHKDYLDNYQEIIDQIKKGRKVEPFDCPFIAKDGSTVYLEGNAAGMFQEGELVVFTFILRDITERKKAAAELSARLKRETMIAQIAKLIANTETPGSTYDAVLEIIGKSAGIECVWLGSFDDVGKNIDLIGRWDSTIDNQHPLNDNFPYTSIPYIIENIFKGDRIYCDSIEVLPESDRGLFTQSEIKSFLILPVFMGQDITGMMGFATKSNYHVWDEAEIAMLTASSDILANAWRRQMEVDARIQKEAEAKQSRLLVIRADRLAALGTMTAGIIHEITQPLNAINVSAQTILYGLQRGWNIDGDQVTNSLNLIVEQIKRITTIITNMRAFSRDGSTVAKENGNLNTQIERVLSMLGEQLNAHNITVETVYGDVPDVLMNTQQILQVIMNLITNARQALDETDSDEKKITIISKATEDEVVLEVTNNGPYIPEEIMNRIFDPFFTTKEVGKGTGLGLSISTGFIQDHNGVLDCRNNETGGVTFMVMLPRYNKKMEKNSEYSAG